LAWERRQESRHEYHDGEIIALAGASLKHNYINTNLVLAIGGSLRNNYCDVFSNDLRLEISTANAYYYPDLMIVCGNTGMDKKQDTITHPTVIIEILSPSTRDTDLSRKKTDYLTLSSLKEYIVVDSTAVWVRCLRKNETDQWESTTLDRREDSLLIRTTGQHIPLHEIYRKTGL